MNIFLLSSHTEGTTMTLREAMSQSKPCVVTWVGGNPELVQDETNYLLVPTGDVEAFFAAMTKLASEEVPWDGLGENANTVFHRRVSATKMAEHYTVCYQHVVSC